MDWKSISVCRPPQNLVIWTMIKDEKGARNEQKLIFSNGLWWVPDRSIYVYYTPTHWKHCDVTI